MEINKMLTLLTEIIVGAFVANFDSAKHPYVLNFFKGVLVGLFGYIFGNLLSFMNTKTFMPFDDQLLFLIISQLIGFLLFLFLSIIDFFNRY